MRTLLNIVWLVFGGFWLALGYALAGVLFCVLIITIPLGVASFRMASYALWPFGRAVVRQRDAGAGSVVPYGKEIVPAAALPPQDRPLHSI